MCVCALRCCWMVPLVCVVVVASFCCSTVFAQRFPYALHVIARCDVTELFLLMIFNDFVFCAVLLLSRCCVCFTVVCFLRCFLFFVSHVRYSYLVCCFVVLLVRYCLFRFVFISCVPVYLSVIVLRCL